MKSLIHLETLKSDFERCGLTPAIHQCLFTDWKNIPKKNGLYSIWQDNLCIYVGQGGGKKGINGRFQTHHNKAYAIESSSTTHPKGWVVSRLQPDWKPLTWVVEYIFVERAVHRTYLEGVMMLEFDPLCNDENYEDRLVDQK